jgi:hypothetical protein
MAMRYINAIAVAIITLIISKSALAVPTAYDANLPDLMDSGEYVLGYEPAYINETLDYGATTVYFGRNTASNTFLIKQGCTLISGNNSAIGNNGSYNTTTIEDGGIWQIGAIFHVGWNGDYNKIMINENSSVTNTTIAYVGRAGTADYNSAVISGGEWNCGTIFNCGERGIGNSVEIIKGGTINCADGRIGWTDNSSNNTVTIDGSNTTSASTWKISGPLTLGRYLNASDSKINISNGGQLITSGTSIGRAGSGHTINIDGKGSKWLEKSYVNLGWGGTKNIVRVSNGATLDSPVGISLGHDLSSHNNSLQVDGEGSTLITRDLRVGKYGTNNTAIISGASSVSVTNAFIIGDIATADNNNTTVTDNDSILYVTSVIYIGLKGSSNTLTVANESLVKLDGYDIRIDHTDSTNNFLRMQGGCVAWVGNRITNLTNKESKFKLWNKATEEFEIVTSLNAAEKTALNYTLAYYTTDEEAKAVTGYDGLGGYTIITGGDNTTPPGGTIIIIQ